MDLREKMHGDYYASMPKYAIDPHPDVIAGRSRLLDYLVSSNTTETALSRECGIPQYTISRFLHGHIKSLTPTVKKLLTYADIRILNRHGAVVDDPRIQRALVNAWDGTDGGIELLARAIDALGPVIRNSTWKSPREE